MICKEYTCYHNDTSNQWSTTFIIDCTQWTRHRRRGFQWAQRGTNLIHAQNTHITIRLPDHLSAVNVATCLCITAALTCPSRLTQGGKKVLIIRPQSLKITACWLEMINQWPQQGSVGAKLLVEHNHMGGERIFLLFSSCHVKPQQSSITWEMTAIPVCPVTGQWLTDGLATCVNRTHELEPMSRSTVF